MSKHDKLEPGFEFESDASFFAFSTNRSTGFKINLTRVNPDKKARILMTTRNQKMVPDGSYP